MKFIGALIVLIAVIGLGVAILLEAHSGSLPGIEDIDEP